MAEIKVKRTSLEDEIKKLGNLKNKCLNYGDSNPQCVGGGSTVTEIQNLVNLYNDLDRHFIQLVSNTIEFMNNVNTSYVESDKKAADSINSK